MNRPSRGACASATTKRYVGCFLAPMRRSRIFTISSLNQSPSPRSAEVLGHLACLIELFHQPVDVGNGTSRTASDSLAARSVEDIRMAAFPAGHRADDR